MGKLAITGGKPIRKKPFTAWPVYTQQEARGLQKVLASRNWGGYPFPNKIADAFAQKFARYHGAKYGLAVANGTIAIEIALKAAGIKPGDEVIVPAYTWEGTVGPILLLNAVPVFVDIDPATYCLDAKLIEAALTPKTRAILPVHLAMRFADLDEICRIAKAHNLVVIEDCAHAHGGKWRSKGAGATGDVGLLQLSVEQIDDFRRRRRHHHQQPGILRARAVLHELRPGQRDRSIPAPPDRIQLPHHRAPGRDSGRATRASAEAGQSPPGQHGPL